MVSLDKTRKGVSIKKKWNVISSNFKNIIVVYHKTFRRLIKGEVWEDIFENIMTKSKIEVISKVTTSNVSGRDIELSLGWFSLKTVELREKKNGCYSGSISSYRLGKVRDNMVEAIELKNSSFKYYSILTKTKEKDGVVYSLYIIPSACCLLNPSRFTWAWNENFTVYKTNTLDKVSMSVRASMSHHLWVKIEDWEWCFKEFKIASVWVKPVDTIKLI